MKSKLSSLHYILFISVCSMFLMLTIACKNKDAKILNKEEMASLLADLHIGESVVDYNFGKYPNDSTRKTLKQSIYIAHGVTAEQVDSSLIYYGHHIDEYLKVYDRTLEILKERTDQFASNILSNVSDNDSLIVWSGPERLHIDQKNSPYILNFDVPYDTTWRDGDIFRLKYRLINSSEMPLARLLVEYKSGKIKYTDRSRSVAGSYELRINVDSMQSPVRIAAFLEFPSDNSSHYEIDSISLTRLRKSLVHDFYEQTNSFDPLNVKKTNNNLTNISNSYTAESHKYSYHNHQQPQRVNGKVTRKSTSYTNTQHRNEAASISTTKPQSKQPQKQNQEILSRRKATNTQQHQ